MIASEFINNSIPRLYLQDTVHKALQLMNDYGVSHLPIVSENIFLGLISEEDLQDAEDDKIPIELLEENFKAVSVLKDMFFLAAVNICNQHEVSVLPVINTSKELLGVITRAELLKAVGDFCGSQLQGGVIVLEMAPQQFSISEISRIIENNECTLLHLNTKLNPSNGLFTVTIQVNKKEIAALIATFERYDYDVVLYFGNEKFENEIKANYEHLMNYLDI